MMWIHVGAGVGRKQRVVLMPIATAAPTVARWLAAAAAALLGSAAGAEDRYVPLATFKVGDKPGDLASGSSAFLTEYRFQSGGHSYALSRSLRDAVGRDLVFIDDRLVCVLKKRRYSHWYSGGQTDTSSFWSDDDWTGPVYRKDPVHKWEWANEPGGLEYLAAMLREACGLEPIHERRELEREWSSRTMTGAEIADATGNALAQTAAALPLAILSGGYYTARTEGDVRAEQAVKQQDRREVEQFIWSMTLGLPPEGLAALLPVPDLQYTWPKTGTTVNAYHLGSPNRFFVGLIDGRVVWIHADYPGLILQAKLAARQQADTRK